MPHGTNTLSEFKTQQFYDKTTHLVDVGEAQKTFQQLANGKIDRSPDVFSPGTSRGEIFKNVFFNTAQRGATFGAQLGEIAMTAPDYVTGTGSQRQKNHLEGAEQFKDEGIAGNIIKRGGAGVSGLAEVIGDGIGGLLGILTIPLNAAAGNKNHDAHVKTATDTGGKAAGYTAAALIAGCGGAAATLSRIPSVLVKGSLVGVGGLAGSLVGLYRASVRASIGN